MILDPIESVKPHFYGDGIPNEIADQDPRCAACSSFGSGLGIVSNDHDAKISYFSTQVSLHSFNSYIFNHFSCL